MSAATDPPLRPVTLVSVPVVAVVEGAAPAHRLSGPKLVADVDVRAILDVEIACGSRTAVGGRASGEGNLAWSRSSHQRGHIEEGN